MMKKLGLSAFWTSLLLASLFTLSSAASKLGGVAEDLWGNAIDLSQLQEGVVLLHPISTSN
jgi:hypothetical protein